MFSTTHCFPSISLHAKYRVSLSILQSLSYAYIYIYLHLKEHWFCKVTRMCNSNDLKISFRHQQLQLHPPHQEQQLLDVDDDDYTWTTLSKCDSEQLPLGVYLPSTLAQPIDRDQFYPVIRSERKLSRGSTTVRRGSKDLCVSILKVVDTEGHLVGRREVGDQVVLILTAFRKSPPLNLRGSSCLWPKKRL